VSPRDALHELLHPAPWLELHERRTDSRDVEGRWYCHCGADGELHEAHACTRQSTAEDRQRAHDALQAEIECWLALELEVIPESVALEVARNERDWWVAADELLALAEQVLTENARRAA